MDYLDANKRNFTYKAHFWPFSIILNTRIVYYFLQWFSHNPGQNLCGHLIHFCKNHNKHLKLEFTCTSPTPPIQCCMSDLTTLRISWKIPFNIGLGKRGNNCLEKTPFEAKFCRLSTTFCPGLSEKWWAWRSAVLSLAI
jgi:hypothetical protein